MNNDLIMQKTRSKILEELPRRTHLLARYECPYCRKEQSFDVPANANTGSILQQAHSCDSCGSAMDQSDFIEFETI